ncbi:hypothetical protein BC567DRAFT_37838 [Phyllosticta citribraziliensis]
MLLSKGVGVGKRVAVERGGEGRGKCGHRGCKRRAVKRRNRVNRISRITSTPPPPPPPTTHTALLPARLALPSHLRESGYHTTPPTTLSLSLLLSPSFDPSMVRWLPARMPMLAMCLCHHPPHSTSLLLSQTLIAPVIVTAAQASSLALFSSHGPSIVCSALLCSALASCLHSPPLPRPNLLPLRLAQRHLSRDEVRRTNRQTDKRPPAQVGA